MLDWSPKTWAFICAGFALAAGLVAIYAAWGVRTSNSLDFALEDEKRIAFWNGSSAALSSIASALTIVAFWLGKTL